MDHHGSLRVLKLSLCLFNVVGELYGISEEEHPWLANVGDLGWQGVVCGSSRPQDLFSDGDSNFGHSGQAAHEAHIADVSEWLAAFLAGVVDNDSWVLVDLSSGFPIQGSQVIQLVVSCGITKSTEDCASCLSQLGEHVGTDHHTFRYCSV